MTTEQIQSIVEREIGDDWRRTNAHGCDLRTCLVEPRLITFTDFGNDALVDLWLVLEEDPVTCDGYKIVYDPTEKAFGLAIRGRDGLSYFIGLYGDFMTTFEAM